MPNKSLKYLNASGAWQVKVKSPLWCAGVVCDPCLLIKIKLDYLSVMIQRLKIFAVHLKIGGVVCDRCMLSIKVINIKHDCLSAIKLLYIAFWEFENQWKKLLYVAFDENLFYLWHTTLVVHSNFKKNCILN